MEDAPPSYEAATSQDHWKIIAAYIDSLDLTRCILVCKKWNELFTPYLWGSPASHFSIEDDSVYAALNRFRRILPAARLHLRNLTHTLQLPPAHTEAYEGPHAEWLRDVLECLPNLQSLIVNDLPFFDHASLLTLRYPSLSSRKSMPSQFPVFNLRLLIAPKCLYTTPLSLSEALKHLPRLLYLDISYCPAARDASVLMSLSFLRFLRVLKLQGTGLRDEEVEILSSSIRLRVRSLDIRDNAISDQGIRSVLFRCIKGLCISPTDDSRMLRSWDELTWDSPVSENDHRQTGHATDQLEAQVKDRVTSGLLDSFPLEVEADSGLSNLYISGNAIAVETVAALLSSRRIFVLDVGDVTKHSRVLPAHRTLTTDSNPETPGAEKLTAVAAATRMRNLEFLRVHHDIVTKKTVHIVSEDTHTDVAPRYAISHERTDKNLSVPERSANTRTRSCSKVREERISNSEHDHKYSRFLAPSMVPKLRTLVLTNVPAFVNTRTIIERLIDFISRCAYQAQLAKEEARVAYDMPPGRSRHLMEENYAKSVFALERLILEVTQPNTPQHFERRRSTWRGHSNHRSSTEDADSDAFWSASQDDFSFFANEDNSMPMQSQTFALSPTSFIESNQDNAEDRLPTSEPPEAASRSASFVEKMKLDVIAEVSSFRREKRDANSLLQVQHNNRVKRSTKSDHEMMEETDESSVDPKVGEYLPGHWDGKIIVKRMSDSVNRPS